MARMKGTPNKPKKVALRKARQVKEVIKDLDEIFEMDELVDIDEILSEGIKESVGSLETQKQESHHENAQSLGNRLFDTEIGKFCTYLIQTYRITEDPDIFLLLFRYYLLKENLNLSDLTPRRIEKFLREYSNYDLQSVQTVLMSLE